ncbi:glutaredoxin [Babesia ovata]|uniref:Glutaredoxin n=1 Tax=Babesia ovata TaxID=189622 RepID=A0A2H6KB96_9APIC|nr:glutaredoxin [Babesia ovata]GBE60273.1 glutaredoxin [Babesia ovata]
MPIRPWMRIFEGIGRRGVRLSCSITDRFNTVLRKTVAFAAISICGAYAAQVVYPSRFLGSSPFPAIACCKEAVQNEEHGNHSTYAPSGCNPQDHHQQEAAESNAKDSLQNLELTPAAEARIRLEISQYDVVLFMKGTASKPACKFSRHALDILKASRVPTIRTVNVLEDPELRAGIKCFSEYPYIPQLYVRGVFIGGLEKIIAMHEDGSLKKCMEG